MRSTWIRQSFQQISYLENMISTRRRCPETTSQTFHPVWLPNQGTFQWSAISYVSQSCSCSAQQKIPALNGKSNSATREPQREQMLLSFSCLAPILSSPPGSFWVSVRHNTVRVRNNITQKSATPSRQDLLFFSSGYSNSCSRLSQPT